MRILIVEDDDGIAAPLAEGLSREGFNVTRAATGAEALAVPEPDLVLLDLRLPDMDGLDVCRRLRERSQVPIIIVTARAEEADRVVGLELGADDYVVKPFGLRELIARIRAVTRRSDEPDHGPAPLRVGGLEVNGRARRAFLDGVELDLTSGSSKTIDVHVASLRRKLGDPTWIETVRGIGFRLRTA
jgi:two-component system response regulator RegX3